MTDPIPNRLVFIWLGRTLPVPAVVAIRSAMRITQPEEALLVHEGLDPRGPYIGDLRKEGLRMKDAGDDWFDDLPPGGRTAARLFGQLTSPASRANLLRLAVLYKLGGVYLDMDTITVRDLAPLRRYRGFCGTEHVALPGDLYDTRNPLRWAAAGVRLAVRDGCARLHAGPGLFRRIQRFYRLAVNNAVLGASPENPLLGRGFARIEAMDPARRMRRYVLGTHLLQELTRNRSSDHMQVLPPPYFYPLGPEISVHWFRRESASRLHELMTEETHVVHWYSSVEERVGVRSLDEDFIEKNQRDCAFANLAAPYLHAAIP